MSTRLQDKLKQQSIGGICTLLLCVSGIVLAAPEIEPNDTQAQAQVLGITSTGATVSAMMGTGGLTTDLDLYAFDAKAGDVPNIMVVTDGKWDPFLVLYDAAGNILDQNDDAVTINPGSISDLDSRIDSFRIPADGRYYAAVTPLPRYLDSNFTVVITETSAGGAYTLSIQGVTANVVASDPVPEPAPEPIPPTTDTGPETKVVTIKVMHWQGDDPGLGKFNGKDPIPVAILSAPDFDAMKIDQQTLSFGATGEEKSLLRCRKPGKDVKVDRSRDGVKDLVCFFRPDVAGFTVGDVQAFLNATTVTGVKVRGSGALRNATVSNKKDKSWHKRHNVNPRRKAK